MFSFTAKKIDGVFRKVRPCQCIYYLSDLRNNQVIVSSGFKTGILILLFLISVSMENINQCIKEV